MSVDQRIANLEAELAALKAEREAEKNPPAPEMITVFDGWKPGPNDLYACVSLVEPRGCTGYTMVMGGEVKRRCAAFKTEAQARAVADAIAVMLELRNQPGAGTYDDSEDGWVAQLAGKELDTDFWGKYKAQAMLCPPFGSEEQLVAALDAVGRDRAERALRVWGMLPVEVQS